MYVRAGTPRIRSPQNLPERFSFLEHIPVFGFYLHCVDVGIRTATEPFSRIRLNNDCESLSYN